MATEKKINKKQVSEQTIVDANEKNLNPNNDQNRSGLHTPSPAEINPINVKEGKSKTSKKMATADDGTKVSSSVPQKTSAKKITANKAVDGKAKVKAKEKASAPKKTTSKGKKITHAAVEESHQQSNPEVLPEETYPAPVAINHIKRIVFQIKYHTQLGDTIFVTGDHPLLGSNNTDHAFKLEYLNEDFWFGQLDVPADQALNTSFAYKYFVKNQFGISDIELVSDKYFNPNEYQVEEVRLVDSWSFAGHFENTFLTEPFKHVLLKHNYNPGHIGQPATYTHLFKVKAPLLNANQAVGIFGSSNQFGKWETTDPVLLSRQPEDDYWTLHVDLTTASYPITYKYGIVDTTNNTLVKLEEDKNRVVYDGAGPDKLTILSDGFAVFANNTFKGAGVAIPVFSLRSNESFGVGEFNDMKRLVDWARLVGMKVIQILPVNDTIATHTWIDSYPYAAISAFALHPMFLHLADVASEENKPLLNELEVTRNQLNNLAQVDYEKTVQTKLDFVTRIFPSQKEATFNSEAFVTFFEENKHWLVPYAAFSYLRNEYGTPDFSSWPKYNQYNADEILQLVSTPMQSVDKISVHFFMQFHLHLQLKAATEYAHENGIIVKGDIPIGIYRNSADAWQEPALYNMDMQAGAPPDDFAVKGQNWGFPTYNWQRMQQDGFSWWKKRFAQMSYYFDAFRIDHILGFFRIWSIPMHAVQGIMGTFVPALPLYKSELDGAGIYMDVSRFTIPYINESILWEEFGGSTPWVKDHFLYESGFEHYALKPEFSNQRQVLEYFEKLPATPENEHVKYGLFNLVSNIILFDVEGSHGNEFHFRIAMEDTASFRYLDGETQHKLRELYVNYFFRRQDNFWKEEAMHKLPELKRSTNMLICGEDLGMVPDCVPGVMNQLGILSLEIQRMPKDPTREFFHPGDAPYLSVVTPSTHDMSTIRGWWEEDYQKTTRFYHHQLGKWGNAPFFCEPEIVQAIITQHVYSPAMWSIFQLQDLLGMDGSIRRTNPADERINVPANPQHYWQYRMHLTLDELIEQAAFNNNLKQLLTESGR